MLRSGDFGGGGAAPVSYRWGLCGLLILSCAAVLAAGAPKAEVSPGMQVSAVQPVRLPPDRAPYPAIETAGFTTTDALSLPMRNWLPQGDPQAVILALHGFNDYSNAFDAPAKIWAARGIATYAYDQRGFGGAPGRTLWPGSEALATDAVTAAALLRRMYPRKPGYLLGGSIGGAVAVPAASRATRNPPPPRDGGSRSGAAGG